MGWPFRHLLQQLHRLPSYLVRQPGPSRRPVQPGETPQSLRLPGDVTHLPEEVDGAMQCLHSLAVAVRHPALAGVLVQQHRPGVRVEAVDHPQQTLVVGDGFSVGVGGDGGPGGCRAVRHQRIGVSRRLSVMDDSRRIGLVCDQGPQHHPVEAPPPQRGQRLLDRPAGQLVAERHRIGFHPHDLTLLGHLQGLLPAGSTLVQQPQLASRRHHRHQLQHLSSLRGELRYPCQHGLGNGGGYLPPALQDLRHEERVAGRGPVQLCRRQTRCLGELGHGGHRQRSEVDPDHHVGRDAPQHRGQRVCDRHLLGAEGQHQQRRQRRHPPR